MIEINNNNQFIDFGTDNFWYGQDESSIKEFAQDFMHGSLTYFKVKFDILAQTNKKEAKDLFDKFENYCNQNNYTLSKEVKYKAEMLFKDIDKKAKVKLNLTKWKNKYRRKVRTQEREL